MNSNRSTAASTLYNASLRSLRRLALLPPLILPVAGARSSSLPLLKQNPPQPAMPRDHASGAAHAVLAFDRFWGIH
jgi:hypothetical protein